MTQAFDPRALESKRTNASISATLLKMRSVNEPERIVDGDEAPALAKTRPVSVVRVIRSAPAAEVGPEEDDDVTAAPAPAPSHVRLVDNAEPALGREQRRSRRKRDIRARTVSVKRLSKASLDVARALEPDDGERRLPFTRGDCVGGPRPCPLVSCVHNLFLDVTPRTGAIKLNYPDLDPEDMTESCALDVADRQGETLEKVGEIMNLTRERIRQVEVKALAKLEAHREGLKLSEYADGTRGCDGKRRLPILANYLDEGLDEDDAVDEAFAAEE